jgi:predicted ribosome quality control (RQC) complex YloA/Tae2 family protein
VEGVFLSAVRSELDRRLAGSRCTSVASPGEHCLALGFPPGTLQLCATPGQPSVRLEPGHPSAGTRAGPWIDHLEGAVLESVGQTGLDRVLVFLFRKRAAYGNPSSRLVFEAAGRNTNLILVREGDGRILACTRQVTREISRIRTLSPGALYAPPPQSGEPPSRWADPDVVEALSRATSPAGVFRLLEGVGPCTASAVLEEASRRGVPPGIVVLELLDAITSGRFEPWLTACGPLPVRLGEGTPITDVLGGDPGSTGRPVAVDRSAGLESRLRERLEALRKKLSRVEEALAGARPAETFRSWGGLLLARASEISRGAPEAVLQDWEGVEQRIPLRESRTAVENAERYFRKARNADLERRHLEQTRESVLASIAETELGITEAGSSPDTAGLQAIRKRLLDGKRRGPAVRELEGGWRCVTGGNAEENERVTFGIGRRGDTWLHARGLPGPHVLLHHDGRPGNPPASVLESAARIAALGSRATSDVVPVDYTLVQHVRKRKGGKPGEVLYTGEKTVFVRLGARGVRGRLRSPSEDLH